ncbi:MAG: GNAT family N-acetyltransferase [Acidobacteria bacterium]|nr:GNAT family N-acetyltransferase [Acidobacteriota bacterium]MCB9398568.1 GNAT family N-acetyltransferase [Acidobacteriota bacterium]
MLVQVDYYQHLIDSDRHYFQWGGQFEDRGAYLRVCQPDLKHTPLGCIVWERAPMAGPVLRALEDELSGAGYSFIRLYTTFDGPKPGFQPKIEYLMALAPNRPSSSFLELRQIQTDADWALKSHLVSTSQTASDGRFHRADDWIAFEKSRQASGYQFFLAFQGDWVVGAIGAQAKSQWVRLKNLWVHPAHRRNGCGSAIVGACLERFQQCAWAGCFSLRSGKQNLYERLGFQTVGKVTEWFKKIH